MTSDFTVEQTGNCRIVNVIGEVDIATIPAFRSSLAEQSSDELPHTIVDLSQCRYMDSTGISVLVAQRRDEPTFGVVLPPEHKLQRLFYITGLHKLLNIFSTREAALEAARDLKRDDA